MSEVLLIMFKIFFKKYFYKFFTGAEKQSITVYTHMYCKKSVRKLKIKNDDCYIESSSKTRLA